MSKRSLRSSICSCRGGTAGSPLKSGVFRLRVTRVRSLRDVDFVVEWLACVGRSQSIVPGQRCQSGRRTRIATLHHCSSPQFLCGEGIAENRRESTGASPNCLWRVLRAGPGLATSGCFAQVNRGESAGASPKWGFGTCWFGSSWRDPCDG